MEQPPLVGYIPAPPGAALPNRAHLERRKLCTTNEAEPQSGKAADSPPNVLGLTRPCRSEALPR